MSVAGAPLSQTTAWRATKALCGYRRVVQPVVCCWAWISECGSVGWRGAEWRGGEPFSVFAKWSQLSVAAAARCCAVLCCAVLRPARCCSVLCLGPPGAVLCSRCVGQCCVLNKGPLGAVPCCLAVFRPARCSSSSLVLCCAVFRPARCSCLVLCCAVLCSEALRPCEAAAGGRAVPCVGTACRRFLSRRPRPWLSWAHAPAVGGST